MAHPGVAAHMHRTLATGDFSALLAFLEQNPMILAAAKRNIALAEHQSADNPFRPYPTREESADSLKGPLILGFVNHFDDCFGIEPDILCRPMIILGRVGSGKSAFIKYMLWQSLIRPHDFNVLIPDLKKEYRHLLPITKNLKLLTVNKLKLNPLQVPRWCHPMDHLVAFARSFVSENYLVGTSENLLIELVQWLYGQRDIFSGSQNYPILRDLFNIAHKRGNAGKSFSDRDAFSRLTNRLRPYLHLGCFDCQQGIPFEVFKEKSLVLEMDTGFTDRMYNFTVATLINQLYMHNKARGLTGSRLRHWINVDEARILFQAERNVGLYGESIVNELLTKTREFGIGFTLLSQETASINRTLRSLAYLKVAFPLNDKADLDWIKGSFGLSKEQTEYVFSLPPFGRAIVRYGGFEKAFLLQVPHFRIKRQVDDAQAAKAMAGFWQGLETVSTSKPGDTDKKPQPEIPPAYTALLVYLGQNPFAKTAELKQAPGLTSPAQVNKALAWLEQHGFIKRERYRASATKKTAFSVLQPEALDYLGISGPSGKGSFEHRLYQHLICEWSQAQGAKAKIEGRMKGSDKAIDVLCEFPNNRFTAYEVTLHMENLLSNILADFGSGVNELVIVTRDKSAQQKVKDLVSAQLFAPSWHEQISFLCIDAFFKS